MSVWIKTRVNPRHISIPSNLKIYLNLLWKCDADQLRAMFHNAVSAHSHPSTQSIGLCSSVLSAAEPISWYMAVARTRQPNISPKFRPFCTSFVIYEVSSDVSNHAPSDVINSVLIALITVCLSLEDRHIPNSSWWKLFLVKWHGFHHGSISMKLAPIKWCYIFSILRISDFGVLIWYRSYKPGMSVFIITTRQIWGIW